MSLTRAEQMQDYKAEYLQNGKVEWLVKHGKIRESVYFKGATGDRYTIYIATKRNKNIVDFHGIYNSYDHGTALGQGVIATLDKKFILTTEKEGSYWYRGIGNTLKQLMRQGVVPKACNYDIRFCRSTYMLRFRDKETSKILEEVSPWLGMKLDLKHGKLINNPTLASKAIYKKAKEWDKSARKANYRANKNNVDALKRYREAGGDTQFARSRWVNDGSQVDADPTLETINWDLIPMNDVFKHRNATLRSNIIEHYGMNAIIATLDYDIVDKDTIDGRKYRLLDVIIPDESIVRSDQEGVITSHKGLYLEMINPSTGESHFEGVSNVGKWGGLQFPTVKEALKWRDGDAQIRSNDAWGENNDETTYIEPVILT